MKHNIYYKEKVQSLGFELNGKYISVGVIEPGSYKFSTEHYEIVTILEGAITVKINYETSRVDKGGSYEVEKNKEFEVSCEDPVAYICYYK